MSSDSFRRRSISKQRGAAMSSRLMPPNVGATPSTMRTISSTSVVFRHSGKASTPAELLEEHRLALHHRHRGLGADVAQPEHGGAVGDDRDRVALDRQRPRGLGVVVDRGRHARDAGRVGHREVVAGLDRDLAVDLDLAALVHQERAVRDARDLHALERPHRVDDALAVRRVDAGHGHVARDAALVDAHEVDRAEDRALVTDRVRHRGERARQLAQLDAHGEGVGGRGLEPRRRLQAGHASNRVTGARLSA